MQRLLITGGCGYLGRALVGRAPAHGFQVRATWHEHRPPTAGDWVRVDVREAGAVREAMRGVDAVIHTAYRQDGNEWQVNAAGSAVVAEAARGRRLVHLSSDVVFRGDRGRYREADEPDPVNAYGRSKAEAERRVAAVHPAATIVRTSLIYGGEGLSGHERRILDVVDGRADLAFFTDELRCPVRVSDLADAVLALARIAHAGPLHLAGADGVSRYELACLVAKANGRETAHLRMRTSAGMQPERPRDCRLDCSRAAALLGGPLPGIREILGNWHPPWMPIG